MIYCYYTVFGGIFMKKIIWVILIIAVIFIIAKTCGDDPSSPAPDVSSVPLLSESSSELMLPEQNTNDFPTFSSYKALSVYLNSQIDAGSREISFYYSGEKPTPEQICRMTSVYYIYTSIEGDLITVTPLEYPGDRIVRAWKRGNTSVLSADEKRALSVAESVISEAKRASAKPLEQERYIHDYLINHVTYFDDDTIENPDRPSRHLSVLGALLDGRANCQGYTDAFYTLASMLGFTVDRMSVVCDDGELHMVNTVLLDGSWYVTDVTLDDKDNAFNLYYASLNVGLDQLDEIYWPAENEIHPIAAQTDSDWDYYAACDNSFPSAEAFASDAFGKWKQSGKGVFFGRLEKSVGQNAFEGALNSAADATGLRYNYNYWHYETGRHTYVYLTIK